MKSELEQGRATTFIPVLTMEEAPLLSEAERAELLASLVRAEADAAANRGRIFDAETFVEEAMARRAQYVGAPAR